MENENVNIPLEVLPLKHKVVIVIVSGIAAMAAEALVTKGYTRGLMAYRNRTTTEL